jgi:phage integrase family site-specific recombinase
MYIGFAAFLFNHKIRRGIRLTKADYIFRSLKNETQPMTLTAVTHIFADLKEKLSLPKNLRFHLFRHIHATLLAEQEVSAKKIQMYLGHTSASFTMDRYVHNTEQMQEGVTERIAQVEEIYER